MVQPRANGNGRRLATPQSVDAAIKSICDIMRRSNCAGALQGGTREVADAIATLRKMRP